ncbi:MAG: TolC family protein [Planctomycetota bacterium]|jgi:outer membrane protein TolC
MTTRQIALLRLQSGKVLCPGVDGMRTLKYLALLLPLMLTAAAAGAAETNANTELTATLGEVPDPSLDATPAGTGEERTSAEAVSSEVPLTLSPVSVINLTVRFSPGIKRSFERKTAKEARYDFFIANRESISYGVVTDFGYERERVGSDRGLTKTLEPQLQLRKNFFNTSAVSLSTGYSLEDTEEDHGGDAFVRGTVRVPLFGSREALQRSNLKIFEQNEVNDARLDYLMAIRFGVFEALMQLAWCQSNQERLRYAQEYLTDLKELLALAKSITTRDTSADELKLAATIASTQADIASDESRLRVSIERLKLAVGVPFETPVSISNGGFNPFESECEEDLCKIALETDEEIKTLLNSIKSSQAELSLARKGKWDTSLSVSATRRFDGDGELEDQGSYDLFSGVEVRTIDPRISRSLERIALANIREYRSAIENRQRQIRTDTVEAFSTLAAQQEEVNAREANLSRYWESYSKALELYDSGHITVEELLEKREDIYGEQEQIARARNRARMNVASLLSSTGRYEQFLEKDTEEEAREQTGP